MNKIQFQKGMSLNQFLARYGDEQQCEAALEDARWPEGFRCAKCQSKEHYQYRRRSVKIFQCRICRTQTTLTEGTIFHSTKLPLTIWFQAMYLLTQNKNNVSALELRRLVGISYPAAWRMKHKLMQVMCERESATRLSGRVEVDDAYLGGEYPGGKAGRGSENKVAFIAAVQTNDQNNPLYAVFSQVKALSGEEVASWAKKSLAPSATVISDGLWCRDSKPKAIRHSDDFLRDALFRRRALCIKSLLVKGSSGGARSFSVFPKLLRLLCLKRCGILARHRRRTATRLNRYPTNVPAFFLFGGSD